VGQGDCRGAALEVVVVPGWENGVVSYRYRSSNKTVYSAKYHLIWCPKYRRRVLISAVEERLPLEVVRRDVENQKTAA